jgi:hypothetical protein
MESRNGRQEVAGACRVPVESDVESVEQGIAAQAANREEEMNAQPPSSFATNPSSRSRAMSLVGAFPKKRPYSLLNCDALR